MDPTYDASPHHPGWLSLINPLKEMCALEGVEILQIKEKFGGLRFYVDGGSKELQQAIRWAMDESLKMCEKCGSREDVEAKTSPPLHVWIKTLCEDCRNATARYRS